MLLRQRGQTYSKEVKANQIIDPNTSAAEKIMTKPPAIPNQYPTGPAAKAQRKQRNTIPMRRKYERLIA
jgi:hypothetical protein